MIRRWFIAVAILVTVCGPSFAASVAFSDQTVSAQLIYSPGSPLDMDSKEMYHGGSVGDFNRDGWPDLFLLGGGMVADALFINDGDGTFTNEAIAWGVDFVHRGRGSTVGDYNNDGWPDLYVTSGGDLGGADRLGQHRLYENNGNGTFTERGVAAGVNESSSLYATATGAAFGDYDLDGDLDLFVCGWEAMSCHINPCELGHEQVTSMARLLREPVGMAEVTRKLLSRFIELFPGKWQTLTADKLLREIEIDEKIYQSRGTQK